MDEDRLYEVSARGRAWTRARDAQAAARRLVRLRWLLAIGIGVNAATWTLAGLALVAGGREWGATFGLLAVLTVPLLLLPLLVEGTAGLRGWRRHSRRPPDFPKPE